MKDPARTELEELSTEALSEFFVARQEGQESEKSENIWLFKMLVKLFPTKDGVALQEGLVDEPDEQKAWRELLLPFVKSF